MTETDSASPPRRGRRAEHTAATRQLLVDVARRRFTEDGYAQTPIEPIVAEAGLTRGALYYHFSSKEDLFCAVFESVEQELVERIHTTAASEATDAWSLVERGIDAFLSAAVDDPAVHRIAFVDGPAILGWQRWRELHSKYSLDVVRMALGAAIADDQIDEVDVDSLAPLVLAVLCEAALAIAHSESPESEIARQREAVLQLVTALRTAHSVDSA